ncbi:hypothetical protein NE473_31020, partial [Hungatella sp. SL.1.14]|nr:hypothetical protein [Hungatella sp. SL.1.14]
LKAAVIDPLFDSEYRKIIGLYMFWNLALQVAGPFFSVYIVTGLSLDYTYITFLGLIASSVRVVAACFWGYLGKYRTGRADPGYDYCIHGESPRVSAS